VIADAGRSFGYPFLHSTVAATDVHIQFQSTSSNGPGIHCRRPIMVAAGASKFLDHELLAKC
jgi:hypothetical protein